MAEVDPRFMMKRALSAPGARLCQPVLALASAIKGGGGGDVKRIYLETEVFRALFEAECRHYNNHDSPYRFEIMGIEILPASEAIWA